MPPAGQAIPDSGSGFLPQPYVGWRELVATGDMLSDDGDNKDIRSRIRARWVSRPPIWPP